MLTKHYDAVNFVMGKLIGKWGDNQDAVKKGRTVNLLAAGSAVVSAYVTVGSGGSLLPAAYAGFVALYNVGDTPADPVSR